jgi:hypothetical protein
VEINWEVSNQTFICMFDTRFWYVYSKINTFILSGSTLQKYLIMRIRSYSGFSSYIKTKSFVLYSNRLSFHLDPIYFNATLIKRSLVTHDTDWYTFALPFNVFMSPPIGYHIRLRRLKDSNIELLLCFFTYLHFIQICSL